MYLLVLTAIMVATLTAIVISSARVDRALIAQGKCPTCLGLGELLAGSDDHRGCLHCQSTGTLESHNAYRMEIGLKPIS